ncbi:hypothetical protein CLOHYLEM_05834 [[Clostridium] hylemonae DSM 15053]|uniref:Uncharacterized protein n=1 Tax=[Clostridium] hylemonae DSM 15053 TaxID=553973 RepID=C0C115_9FIRM|nr:hypothetical protein CLOHYLEM_05834 [[Clostridium] hylemonae DSM 15053]
MSRAVNLSEAPAAGGFRILLFLSMTRHRKKTRFFAKILDFSIQS